MVCSRRSAISNYCIYTNLALTLPSSINPCHSSNQKGARAAAGSLLLFLHADTRLPLHFDAALRESLAQEATLATAFRFKVRDDEDEDEGSEDKKEEKEENPKTTQKKKKKKKKKKAVVGVRWMEWTVHIRSSVYELPFGDQAMAMTKQRFEGAFVSEEALLLDSNRFIDLKVISTTLSRRLFFRIRWFHFAFQRSGAFRTSRSWRTSNSSRRYAAPPPPSPPRPPTAAAAAAAATPAARTRAAPRAIPRLRHRLRHCRVGPGSVDMGRAVRRVVVRATGW